MAYLEAWGWSEPQFVISTSNASLIGSMHVILADRPFRFPLHRTPTRLRFALIISR
jgi:hypothetical protein